jgi:hypothetical protein
MSWSGIASYAFVYLAGALTGATGTYLADKYTDQRRQQQKRHGVTRLFAQVAAQMPSLIEEMRTDFADPENASVREFIVMPSSGAHFNSGGRRYLFYHEDKHEDLMGKIAILENNGFVTDTTSTNVPKYRMTEQFVQLLKP